MYFIVSKWAKKINYVVEKNITNTPLMFFPQENKIDPDQPLDMKLEYDLVTPSNMAIISKFLMH